MDWFNEGWMVLDTVAVAVVVVCSDRCSQGKGEHRRAAGASLKKPLGNRGVEISAVSLN